MLLLSRWNLNRAAEAVHLCRDMVMYCYRRREHHLQQYRMQSRPSLHSPRLLLQLQRRPHLSRHP